MYMLCYRVELKRNLSDRSFYLSYYIIKIFFLLPLLMEKTQENKSILPPFLRNNEVVQVQEVSIAHIYISVTNSIKMFIFIKKKTYVDQERFSLGTE